MEAGESSRRPALVAVLGVRDFRILWMGSGISMLGDAFYMIALPWLVLQLTGDALAVGTVMAVGGIPRALFMLVGGALTDRFTPRTIMLVSALFRTALVGLLAALVFTGRIELRMLYVLAFIFGLADAFHFPASATIVPQLVAPDLLSGANAIMHGTGQLTFLVGPALAGGLIALLTTGDPQGLGEAAGSQGIAIAFGFDACTFLISAVALWMMRLPKEGAESEATHAAGSVWASIWEGLVTVWHDRTLRAIFFIIAALNLLLNGPISVGIPVLADARFPEGAAAFGVIMSAFAGGGLLGIILAGTLPKPASRRMGTTFMLLTAPIGMGAILLGFAPSTAFAAAVTFAMGVGEGYVNILFVTWLQARMPFAILGRIMSLVMFASVGLVPISMALTGVFIKWNMTALFAGAGGIMLVIVFLSLFSPAVQAMGLAPRPSESPETNPRPD